MQFIKDHQALVLFALIVLVLAFALWMEAPVISQIFENVPTGPGPNPTGL